MLIYDDHVDRLNCCSTSLIFFWLLNFSWCFRLYSKLFFFNHPSCRQAVGQPARYWAQQLLCREASATRRVITPTFCVSVRPF